MTHEMTTEEQAELLAVLKARFLENKQRHEKISWEEVQAKLNAQPAKIESLAQMERTGGEPDIVGDRLVFIDCSPESPIGRRNVCYDRLALDARKKNKPENDAMTMAQEMGIELLTEEEYRELQSHGLFDLKTSSWVQTPDNVRKLGGAIFCDRRYDRVFTYHNGADSYYSARGFRGRLTL